MPLYVAVAWLEGSSWVLAGYCVRTWVVRDFWGGFFVRWMVVFLV